MAGLFCQWKFAKQTKCFLKVGIVGTLDFESDTQKVSHWTHICCDSWNHPLSVHPDGKRASCVTKQSQRHLCITFLFVSIWIQIHISVQVYNYCLDHAFFIVTRYIMLNCPIDFARNSGMALCWCTDLSSRNPHPGIVVFVFVLQRYQGQCLLIEFHQGGQITENSAESAAWDLQVHRISYSSPMPKENIQPGIMFKNHHVFSCCSEKTWIFFVSMLFLCFSKARCTFDKVKNFVSVSQAEAWNDETPECLAFLSHNLETACLAWGIFGWCSGSYGLPEFASSDSHLTAFLCSIMYTSWFIPWCGVLGGGAGYWPFFSCSIMCGWLLRIRVDPLISWGEVAEFETREIGLMMG